MSTAHPLLDRGEPDSKHRLRLWLRLLRTVRAVEGALREELRVRHGTTLPRFDVLALLHRHPDGLRMSAVSEGLMVSNGNVTGIVDRLVQDGMIERRPVPGDKRATHVRLTRAGRKTFEAMAQAHEGWVDELLGAIDADEASQITEALGRVGR